MKLSGTTKRVIMPEIRLAAIFEREVTEILETKAEVVTSLSVGLIYLVQNESESGMSLLQM